MPSPHVVVIGGGLAGMAASVALADAGYRVSLFEKSPRLGGRATSYILPSGEHIDNCQHVTLGCCTNLQDFYSRIGAASKIANYDSLTFSESLGRRAVIRPSWLPEPLHLLPSFATFPLLGWHDKVRIAYTMIRIVASHGEPALPSSMSMLEFLRKQKQTPRAVERFWKTVLVSALNEELDRVDARYGIAVFWKAFLSSAQGFTMGIPSVPLADLYSSAAARIASANGQAHTRCGVAELQVTPERVTAAVLENGGNVRGDYYVAAVPFDRLLGILPQAMRREEPYRSLEKLRVSPITGVHLWFDRVVMSEPFVTSIDQTIQWVFNKTALCVGTAGRFGQYLQVVVSASHNWSDHSQQEIVEICRKELALILPKTREAELTRSVVIRERSATFSPEPDCDRWRPAQKSPIENLLIAGDWTQTGWPATMEGAVRSGYRAAEEILAMEGRPATLVRPELPPGGLVTWIVKVLGMLHLIGI